jgi:hypothetical protein
VTPEGCRHVRHVYAVRSASREAWQHALARQAIHTGIHYPKPIHLLPAFRELGGRPGQFPHAEAAARSVLSLPMFPELTAAQVQRVAEAVRGLAQEEVPHAAMAAPVAASAGRAAAQEAVTLAPAVTAMSAVPGRAAGMQHADAV